MSEQYQMKVFISSVILTALLGILAGDCLIRRPGLI